MSEKIIVRRSKDRGLTKMDWLTSYHTFSFGEYYEDQYMSLRSLRVINEDFIGPGKGFGSHPHRDMEIITYVISGELEHKDSMGNGSIIKAGDVQKMSAGRGITHSEFNPSPTESIHLLQIWIVPGRRGLDPTYQQISLGKNLEKEGLTLIGALPKQKNVIHIHQDVELFRGFMLKGKSLDYEVKSTRVLWIQVIKGKINVGAQTLQAGDGVSIEGVSKVLISCLEQAEFLLFNLG
jgi:redox-sensitive bicupin YhaK (pirin superfamily)